MKVDLSAALERHFGWTEFRPGQRRVIETLLEGRSAAAVFPTGGGKSLCYQLPALELPGTTVVVSPLIALMKDQIDALAQRGHSAVRLDSSLTADEARKAMADLRSGAVRLVYVAPERFANERFRASLRDLDVALFAVDEAHCISEWGHNFRPDYLKLTRFARECEAERLLALTATATAPVLDDICRGFEIDESDAVRTAFYRPNLTVLATSSMPSERVEQLERRLDERAAGATIVYVTRQRDADEVADALRRAGYSARAYHAGKKSEERTEIQDWFFEQPTPIVVATIAFGMGIDKPDIRYVYHLALPKSLENYSQEIGRAGRDGETSICELFASRDDLNALENFVYGDTPSGAAIERALAEIFTEEAQPGSWVELSLYHLAQSSDVRQLVLSTLLTYLELDGLLSAGTPTYSTFELAPHRSSQEILSSAPAHEQDLLRTLFHHLEKRRKWFRLDLEAACREAGVTRPQALAVLERSAERGDLELRASGVKQRYQLLERPSSLQQLANDLTLRFERREEAELGRLQQVVDLIEADECQVNRLATHFADPLDRDCDHCTWCLRKLDGKVARLRLPERSPSAIAEGPWRRAQLLRQEHLEALEEPRAFTRFLCGLTSPRLTKARLTRHELYGVFEQVPFAELLVRAAE
ncbi:MAG: RecQ family ATP-dependent DNA helicase [Acidobacteriota bacterium]